ncbi:hypothetical protein EN904_26605 [Mesorhizobium sp. M7A.F.Ca.CA.001.07.2.1]|nr:hypothetical protein EN983_11405 [Mesorhizobium sp. M7A.F.Ca.CA.004.08.2.1]RUX99023.1 hypothetical protein EN985_29165 [Mesorhizobium sp. M7A.F.Ca.CA.004.04.1.1]RUY27659.1 hypothetical protein EN984_10570 [Mesorhizobium sp. M7A.F.Ca.CA.004.12.1.1]RUY51059.1 hypothetical protein EN973_28065 [Mesorhizobium sp. M7A.F.Ca.CA.001.12.1.1]RUY92440.1 hypothetical protein EN964_04080 [Mesorhizobium sp. M7A.F.Ca.CA.001.10.2.1]RUZ89699.1 hypothetical protein EN944_27705 [Mesorhizobium sp. M7A.F.Ca.US.0
MMIEGAIDGLPPLPNGERVAGAKRRSGEGAAHRAFVIPGHREAACVKGAVNHPFVILGQSRRAAACADPRIHAVTPAERRKRLRKQAKQGEAQGALFRTVVEHRGNGMDPRVCAASLRSLLRPRMTKNGYGRSLPLGKGERT